MLEKRKGFSLKIYSCFVSSIKLCRLLNLRSILFNLLCGFILFQNSSSQLCSRFSFYVGHHNESSVGSPFMRPFCKEQNDTNGRTCLRYSCGLLEENAVPELLVDVGNDNADVIPPVVEGGSFVSVQSPAAGIQLHLGFSTRHGLVDVLQFRVFTPSDTKQFRYGCVQNNYPSTHPIQKSCDGMTS